MRRRDALRAGGTLLGAGALGTTTSAGAAEPAGPPAAEQSQSFGPLGRLDLRGTKEAVVSPDGSTAFLALSDGYATVDLSDPAAPATLAERRSLLADREDGPMAEVYDVKQSGETLAVVGPANRSGAGPSGALLVDVSDPADPPAEVARWSPLDREAAWGAVRSSLRPLHDVWVRDGLAVLAYWDAGTYLLDVSDPTAPAYIGHVPARPLDDLRDPPAAESLAPPGNHHYAATDPANDLLAVGKESWAVRRDGEVVGGPSGVDLYDVSDPGDPKSLSSVDPPPTAAPTLDGTWTTAHNLELRDGTLYSSWYQGGVKRHDVSDPENPVEETWWTDPAAARFWTARTAVPDSFFVAASMGTRAGASAGLWTLPDEPGTGGDPDALTVPPTGTEADGAGTTPATPTRTPSPTPVPSTAARTDATTAGETATTAAAAPGFEALAAVCGVAGAAALRALRREGP